MREIKFRVWDTAEKRFITLKDYQDLGGIEVENDGTLTLSPRYRFLTSMMIMLERFIPLQFTGLYDKNNVAIYEGDKMKNSKGGKGIVKYSKYGEFVLEFEDDNTMSSFNPAILRNYEVYGNIHEGGSER